MIVKVDRAYLMPDNDELEILTHVLNMAKNKYGFKEEFNKLYDSIINILKQIIEDDIKLLAFQLDRENFVVYKTYLIDDGRRYSIEDSFEENGKTFLNLEEIK